MIETALALVGVVLIPVFWAVITSHMGDGDGVEWGFGIGVVLSEALWILTLVYMGVV